MADVVRTTRKQSLQMAGVIAGTALGLNAVFYVMSGFYYDDKPQLGVDIASVRFAFLLLTLLVSGMSYLAALAPRLVGHGVGAIAGLAALVGGIGAMTTTMPGALGASLIMIGVLMPVLVWRSLVHSREAWSFLIAMLAVLATVTFFGAPKVRHVLGIGLWYALIIPALQIVAVIALAMLRDEYRDAQSIESQKSHAAAL